MKGVGEGPVSEILEERKNGKFEDICDLVKRLNSKAANKKVMESLAYGGGFDCFENIHRKQYFTPSGKYDTFIEHLLRYGNAHKAQIAEAATSLFGTSEDALIPKPPIPKCEEWGLVEKLNREKEVTGIFISGHPLDDYKTEIKYFCNAQLDLLKKMDDLEGRDEISPSDS